MHFKPQNVIGLMHGSSVTSVLQTQLACWEEARKLRNRLHVGVPVMGQLRLQLRVSISPYPCHLQAAPADASETERPFFLCFLFLNNSIYLFLAVPNLHCHAGCSLVAVSGGSSPLAVRGLLIVVALL